MGGTPDWFPMWTPRSCAVSEALQEDVLPAGSMAPCSLLCYPASSCILITSTDGQGCQAVVLTKVIVEPVFVVTTLPLHLGGINDKCGGWNKRLFLAPQPDPSSAGRERVRLLLSGIPCQSTPTWFPSVKFPSLLPGCPYPLRA